MLKYSSVCNEHGFCRVCVLHGYKKRIRSRGLWKTYGFLTITSPKIIFSKKRIWFSLSDIFMHLISNFDKEIQKKVGVEANRLRAAGMMRLINPSCPSQPRQRRERQPRQRSVLTKWWTWGSGDEQQKEAQVSEHRKALQWKELLLNCLLIFYGLYVGPTGWYGFNLYTLITVYLVGID